MSSILITTPVIEKIKQIIRCFETGKIVGADYGKLTILPDGPNQIKQITYGASQTTEFGRLSLLINMYVDEPKAKFAVQLREFRNRIGKHPSLHTNQNFLDLLEKAGDDPVMQAVQNRFFNMYYMQPALQWFSNNKFTLPFSLLVIYDSHIHSGSILSKLRNQFTEKVPVNGGDEKKWITSYVQVRDKWLEESSSKVIANSDYRTDSFIYAIRQNNWLLDQPFQVVNYPDRDEQKKPIVRQIID